MSNDLLLHRGLPANVDAERFIFGSLMIDNAKFSVVATRLTGEMFALEKHRRIWKAMQRLSEAGTPLDRVTLANELLRYEELDSVDGLTYLTSLDDGLPQIASIDSYVDIVIEKYRLRSTAMIAQRVMNAAILGDQPADEISMDGQAQLATQVGTISGSKIEKIDDYVAGFPGGINVMLDPSKWDAGIPTGFAELDDWTDGLHAGEIFLIGARPAQGKTALGSCLAKNIAKQGKTVAMFSLELSKKMFVDRMICEEAGLSYLRYRRGHLDTDERRVLRAATAAVMALPIWVDDSMGIHVADMRVKINSILRKQPVDVILIDYAQLIRGPRGKRFNSENDKFTAIAEELKELAKTTGARLVLLSQLNRESEKGTGDTRPKLSQCRGAGAWEEIAYIGACLFREYARKRDRFDLRDVAELIVEKNRSGRAGTLRLKFTDWLMRFEDPGGVRVEEREKAA